jgi:hypothetical protein
MLVIKQDQINRLAQEALTPRATEYLKQFSPRHCEVIGSEGLHRAVVHGLRNAIRHKLSRQADILLFLELMFWLGSEFPTDPALPWAAQILGAASPDGDQLFAAATDYLDAVNGFNREYALAALRWVVESEPSTIMPGVGPFEDRAMEMLNQAHPRKVARIGATGVRAAVRSAAAVGLANGLQSEGGLAICVGLSFALGHGFAADPLYPWIGRTLRADYPSEQRRIERLFSKTLNYVRAVLRYWQES